MKDFKCECDFCKTHELYCWATVMECKCGCHTSGFTAHDVLCCSLPNILKNDNPHTDLKPANEYREQLNKMQKDDEDEFKRFRETSR